jgi:hypothetical protein
MPAYYTWMTSLSSTVNLRKVLWRFPEAHVKLNPEKCQLFEEMECMGYVISHKGVTTDREKLEAVKCLLPPMDKHQ